MWEQGGKKRRKEVGNNEAGREERGRERANGKKKKKGSGSISSRSFLMSLSNQISKIIYLCASRGHPWTKKYF